MQADSTSRRWVDILAVSCVLFIAYSSLIPFDVSLSAPSSEHGVFWGVHLTETNVPDVLSNLALYLPLGLILRAFFARRRMGAAVSVPAALLVAACLSFSMELAQTFLVSRVSSIADCVCNVLGAAIGVVIYAPESALARRSIRALRAELLEDPTSAQAGGWAVLTALTALAPLDLTFDVSLLAKALRQSYFVPFVKHAELARGDASSLVGPPVTGDFAAVELWHLRVDYFLDVFMFLVLAVLIARRFAARGHGPLFVTLAASGFSAAVAALITAAGLCVMSVGLDVTHILTRSLGSLVGAVFHQAILGALSLRRNETSPPPGNRYRRALLVGVAACALYICVRQLVPFRVETEGAMVKMAAIEWLPLHSYSLARLPQAALDALHKSFRFLTLGVLASLFFITERQQIIRRYRLTVGWWVAVAVAVLELAQCWLPGRVPALTDVLIAWCMTSAGVVIGEILYSNYREVLAEAAPTQEDRVILNVELPPPGKDVPIDSAPRRRRRRRVRQ